MAVVRGLAHHGRPVAEPLKHFFSPERVRAIGDSLAAVHPAFDVRSFERQAVRGLEDRELLARATHIMEAMRAHLPPRYEDALAVVLRSLRPADTSDENLGGGMGGFFYLPHVDLVRVHGVEHFDLSMAAQEELTQRFTCEWSIRPYLERDPDRAHAVLRRWTTHPSAHVRRLVSEGTRIRLPWAGRIPTWERDLDRILGLLEALRDDPSSMVRRSVANNLNDVAKVDPARVVDVTRRWLDGASAERHALVEHALRSLVKRGHGGALALLGFGGAPTVELERVRFAPRRVPIGDAVTVSFELVHRGRRAASLLVDLAVRFVKVRGASAKVFKLKRLTLQPGERAALSKTISLAVHTTRKPNPGRHEVEVVVNGVPHPAGHFDVIEA